MRHYAVIGYPISHSLSPIMHEANFYALNVSATYVAIQVTDLDSDIAMLKMLDGFNVTVPYKEDIMKYLDEIDPLAQKIGAVNTVKCENGKLTGYNTDAIGFYRSFKTFGLESDAKILILGAGGAAKAVFYALVQEGFTQLTIANRTVERASQFCPSTIALSEAEMNLAQYSCIINATSVGLKLGETPINLTHLRPQSIVMDLIYKPKQTTLLEIAKAHSCLSENGLDMLLYQGAEAFKIWYGIEADEATMKQQLEEAIYANR
ncbi:MAG: shikimate dehydrogenase [Turicibacter sp.]